MSLEIIYQDDYIVAINKPHGLLVHRTSIAADATEFALQSLRDQIGKKVYLVHRIDRKTSGVLVFALDPETNAKLGADFRDRKVQKKYLAIVRGWMPEDEGIIDYALTNDKGKTQEAVTRYKVLERVELDVAYDRYKTSRYSIIEVYPETGRMHQIRKHLNHLRYPIIGDRPHGCSKQNKLWKEKWYMTSMMLHALEISFKHPFSDAKVTIKAGLSNEMTRVLAVLGVNSININNH